jgi:hypothetical protein
VKAISKPAPHIAHQNYFWAMPARWLGKSNHEQILVESARKI